MGVFPFHNIDKEFEALNGPPDTQMTQKNKQKLKVSELEEKLPKVNFAEYKMDKYDFFSSIDENTDLDITSKYYDTQDFNEMIKTVYQNENFSLLHTNISSLTGNGEKLEYTFKNLKFDIIAVTETWGV